MKNVCENLVHNMCSNKGSYYYLQCYCYCYNVDNRANQQMKNWRPQGVLIPYDYLESRIT